MISSSFSKNVCTEKTNGKQDHFSMEKMVSCKTWNLHIYTCILNVKTLKIDTNIHILIY